MDRTAKVCCVLVVVLSAQIAIAAVLRPDLLQPVKALWRDSSRQAVQSEQQHVVFKGCFPVSGASTISLDAPLVLNAPTSDGEITLPAGSSYAIATYEIENDQLHVGLYRDDERTPLTIARDQFWAVRFCDGYCRELKPIQGRNPLRDVSPCGWADRQEAAQRLLALAFSSLQKGDDTLAQFQFQYGLKLNPLSAEGWFYYGEANRSSAIRDWEPYRYALDLGLPADLDQLARTRMSERWTQN